MEVVTIMKTANLFEPYNRLLNSLFISPEFLIII